MNLHTFTRNELELNSASLLATDPSEESKGRDGRRQWNNDSACYNRGFRDYFFHQAPLAEAEGGSASGRRDSP